MFSKGTLEFMKAAFKNPWTVSTVFPSYSFLCKALVDCAKIQLHGRVVELGCGTGSVTRFILKKGDLDFYLGVEVDGSLVDFLRKSYPGFEFLQERAHNLGDHVPDSSIDSVIATLPFTLMDSSSLEETLREVRRILKPGGSLVFFITHHMLFTPRGIRVQKLFHKLVGTLEKDKDIFFNLPPARVFHITYRGENNLKL